MDKTSYTCWAACLLLLGMSKKQWWSILVELSLSLSGLAPCRLTETPSTADSILVELSLNQDLPARNISHSIVSLASPPVHATKHAAWSNLRHLMFSMASSILGALGPIARSPLNNRSGTCCPCADMQQAHVLIDDIGWYGWRKQRSQNLFYSIKIESESSFVGGLNNFPSDANKPSIIVFHVILRQQGINFLKLFGIIDITSCRPAAQRNLVSPHLWLRSGTDSIHAPKKKGLGVTNVELLKSRSQVHHSNWAGRGYGSWANKNQKLGLHLLWPWAALAMAQALALWKTAGPVGKQSCTLPET